ncbi:tetratricopeptide repeat protein [Marinoscillum furvescens DSM 4134]|uniref:Tetratricopeptide repeat protein n=2 Tax=Marinoscillum furvescens TaxID=1026 RepID=A0A3D9KWI4_MARFU|nr:tetratricopeptide repeat protein [Marinoscillum furvescens DSM 4134]
MLVLLLNGGVSIAQSVEACGYYGHNAKFSKEQICPQLGFESSEDAEKSIRKILNQLGLQMNFLVVQCSNINNAFAVNLEGDIGHIRYIIYDEGFLERIGMKSQTDWASVSILAHEIGHHLNAHTLDGVGSRPEKELDADEFSGFALNRLGATLEEAQAAMQNAGGEKASKTHPARSDRLNAIAHGWTNAASLSKKYIDLSRNLDYTSYAKMWFEKARAIRGVSEGDHINRVAYYGKATEYKPDYTAAYRNKAKYLNELGLYKKALIEANSAISLDKNYWNAYTEKARAYFGMEDYQEAVKYYSIAIENREPQRAGDYAARAFSYLAMGDRTNAIADLEEALNLRPQWSIIQQKLTELKR